MLQNSSTSIDTNGDGDATVYIGRAIRGFLVALKYTPGTIATGATLTITGETSGIPILTKANAGTSNVFYYPRALPNAVADGSAGAASSEFIPIVGERIKVVVSSGGASKAGTIEAIWLPASPF